MSHSQLVWEAMQPSSILGNLPLHDLSCCSNSTVSCFCASCAPYGSALCMWFEWDQENPGCLLYWGIPGILSSSGRGYQDGWPGQWGKRVTLVLPCMPVPWALPCWVRCGIRVSKKSCYIHFKPWAYRIPADTWLLAAFPCFTTSSCSLIVFPLRCMVKHSVEEFH